MDLRALDVVELVDTPVGELPRLYARSAPLFIRDLFDDAIWEWDQLQSIKQTIDASPLARTFPRDSQPLRRALSKPSLPNLPLTNHVFLNVWRQSGQDDDSLVFSGVCLHCNYHVRIAMQNPGEGSCHHHAPDQSLHSITLSEGPGATQLRIPTNEKYDPVVAASLFRCVSQSCNLVMFVEFSEPRLPWKWVELLQNNQRIKDRISAAKIADPKRYEDASDEWVDGLSHLWTYLRHVLENTGEPRLIKKKNKRFDVVMGPELYDLFRWLEFEETTVNTNGLDEEVFKQNLPEPPSSITPVGSRRAFYEDVRAEVRNMIWRQQMDSSLQEIRENLLELQLQTAFGYEKYEHVRYEGGEINRHYRFLGAMPDFSRGLLEACSDRQIIFDPHNRACYEDSIYSIARDASGPLGSDSVFFRTATTITGPDHEDQFNQCWGLNTGTTRRTDDEIIRAFKQTIRNHPEKIDTAFEFLRIYTGSRQSNRLRRIFSFTMPVHIAYDVLGAGPDDTAKQLVQSVRLRAKQVKPEILIKALETIGRDREDPYIIQQVARMGNGPFVSPYDPIGLQNIGNTCYLNSILQYLYTLKPVNYILENFAELRLPEDQVSNRLIGGSRSEIQLIDLLVGEEFVRELLQLWKRLETKDGPTQPSQAVANGVLLTNEQLLESQADTTGNGVTNEIPEFPLPPNTSSGPPLPARPPKDSEVAGEKLEMDSDSSETLMGDSEPEEDDKPNNGVLESVEQVTPPSPPPETGNEDTPMTDGADCKIEAPIDREAVLRALRERRPGEMMQQDADEIMGRTLGRLQSSIKPTSNLKGDIQNDLVMETFYFSTVTNRIQRGGGQETKYRTSELSRSLTGYPDEEGPCTLYDALDRYFDVEVIENNTASQQSSIEQWSAIDSRTPPILHILIQRTQSNGTKNLNPVIIEESLHLDRYVDSPENSQLMRLRKESWALKKFQAFLKTVPTDVDEPPSSLSMADSAEREVEELDDWLQIEKMPTSDLPFIADGHPDHYAKHQEEHSVYIGDGPGQADAHDSGRKALTPDLWTVQQLMAMQQEEVQLVDQRRQELFENLAEPACSYRLHAVICHSGNLRAGHYWVWIRDFAADGVWRKFNDTRITEEASTEAFLQELNKGGEPYFLCYVRDSDKESFVTMPPRHPESEEETEEEEGGWDDPL